MTGVVFGDLVAGGNSLYSSEWLINLVSLWRPHCIKCGGLSALYFFLRLSEHYVCPKVFGGFAGWWYLLGVGLSNFEKHFSHFQRLYGVSHCGFCCFILKDLSVPGKDEVVSGGQGLTWLQFLPALPLGVVGDSTVSWHVDSLWRACLPLTSYTGTAFANICPQASENIQGNSVALDSTGELFQRVLGRAEALCQVVTKGCFYLMF